MAMTMLSEHRPDVNPQYIRIRADDLDRLVAASDAIRETIMSPPSEYDERYARAVGALQARVTILSAYAAPVLPWDDPAPIGIHRPAEEPFEPAPDESAWAAEHVRPAYPRTAADVLAILADTLESLGLEPSVQGDSIDVAMLGRDYSLRLDDMTAFYDHMESIREDREWDDIGRAELRMPAPEAVAID